MLFVINEFFRLFVSDGQSAKKLLAVLKIKLFIFSRVYWNHDAVFLRENIQVPYQITKHVENKNKNFTMNSCITKYIPILLYFIYHV